MTGVYHCRFYIAHCRFDIFEGVLEIGGGGVGEVGAADAIGEEGVAGEENRGQRTGVREQADGAGGVAGSMDNLKFFSTQVYDLVAGEGKVGGRNGVDRQS